MMDHRLIEGLMEVVVPAVREYVDGALTKAKAPLLEKIAELEARQPIKGEPGEPGKSVTVDDVRPLIVRALSEVPRPVDGKDGAPGERGLDGAPGRDGQDGASGRDGIDGKDGAPGERGLDGAPGRDGQDGASGRDGIDGKDGAPGERGKKGDAGPAGIDGKDGAAGRDGRDASDLTVLRTMVPDIIAKEFTTLMGNLVASSDDNGRTIKLSLALGDAVVTHSIKTGVVLDQGVWEERAFKHGDGVSWDGSFWIAQRDTSTKPGTLGSDWRMAVKRGHNGRAGEPGPPGAKGDKGDRGERGLPGYAQ
jgi:hypothetical protein